MTSGHDLFRQGEFEKAEERFLHDVDSGQATQAAGLKLAELALLRNDHSGVNRWLKAAGTDGEATKTRNTLLAESYSRRDMFAQAAPLERALGQCARADRAQALANCPANEIRGSSSVRVPFTQIDPLPVIEATVNGEPALFFLDTGGWELLLDSKFAARVGIPSFGAVQGSFAGGRKADIEVGIADSVGLGDMHVANVPVHVKPMDAVTQHVFGRALDGVLGTVFLYHFMPTIDYAGQQLVLEPLDAPPPSDKANIPFWLAGRHFVLAKGSVNGVGTGLFHIDTGLAGGGFMCPQSTIERAGIELDETKAFEGMGGGGPVRAIPFDIERLSLGSVDRGLIQGIYSEGFPEEAYGVALTGIISHQFFREGSVTFDFQDMSLYVD
ncbi:aspartyl protease family protein [Candidatus Bipolaricaulota bacterium]|nr:aspartyl protease family protein [Candidatus Bipolaricaulota bacterium]TFH09283.1 MAG: hypothetical protein E4H08_06075 [Candidatus Atribacteria bacterium]